MLSVVEVVATVDGVVRCTGRPPLTPRQTGPGRVHLVGTGGGPLPGDVVDVHVTVGPGAALELGSVAGTIAQRGTLVEPSVWHFHVTVGDGGSLVVPGAPLVAAAGCRHRTVVDVDLAPDASLVWSEVLVAGRTSEEPGSLSTELRVRRAGIPILEQELTLSPALLAGARCVGTVVLVGPGRRPPEARLLGVDAVLMPLGAPDAALALAVGEPAPVHRVLGALRVPVG